jgi:glucose-1-phosphate thymidylyltransferase
MKAVVLAGGYARRMWPLTKERPKHLLHIAGRPMLDYVMASLEAVPAVEEIFVSTNMRFQDQFRDYLDGLSTGKRIRLFVEDTFSEEEKLGSVGALGYLIRENRLDDELLVIGGDNIFSFQMPDFIEYFHAKGANTIALYDVGRKEKARLYGVVDVDRECRIVGFQEKPSDPQSTLISTACYAFTRRGARNVLRYLDEGNDPDKMGYFIEWLYRHDDVYGYVFSGVWFDIGSIDSYRAADEYFSRRGSKPP